MKIFFDRKIVTVIPNKGARYQTYLLSVMYDGLEGKTFYVSGPKAIHESEARLVDDGADTLTFNGAKGITGKPVIFAGPRSEPLEISQEEYDRITSIRKEPW
jgi:hypothetical protein